MWRDMHMDMHMYGTFSKIGNEEDERNENTKMRKRSTVLGVLILIIVKSGRRCADGKNAKKH